MVENEKPDALTALAEERLKLERESLAVERERLAAARVYAQAEAKLARARKPASFFFASALMVVLAFLGGVMAGFFLSEHQRDVRRRDTLSQLDPLGLERAGDTNGVLRATGRVPVSITVIQ